MKNLFAFFKKTAETSSEKFVIRVLPEEKIKKVDDLSNEGNQLEKKKVSPQWLSLVSVFALATGLILMAAILIAKDGFLNALQDRGYFFYIGIGLTVIGIIIRIFISVKNKRSSVDPEVTEFISNAERVAKECGFELGVPETAIEVDVLFPMMKKNKKGEEKIDAFSIVQYLNQSLKIFVENDQFCFADVASVVGIPLTSIKSIKKVYKRIPLVQWNKSEPFNGPTYKQYKLYINQTGFIWSKYYYEVDFEIENEQYCFFLACYEKDAFLNTLGVDIPFFDPKKKSKEI